MKKTILLSCLLFLFLCSYKELGNASREPSKLDREQILCVVNSIRFEAGNQSLRGQRAVFDVVENRSKRWSRSFCQIIKQKNQFSFYPKKWQTSLRNEDWKLYYDVVLNSEPELPEDVLWYHAVYVNPSWKKLQRVKRIQDHIFYRER